MSQHSEPQPYCFPGLEDQDGASCGSGSQLRLMAGGHVAPPSEGSDSSGLEPQSSTQKQRKSKRRMSLPEEDIEMKSVGSSGSGTESQGHESHGHESVGSSSNGNSKDSALLESSGSNKSSNSHSPSPPGSSNAFSLLSSEQDHPSTSGCSSQESAKAKTQKEVIKMLKELKLHLPLDNRHNTKSSTLKTLQFALRCVQQVEANEEYYQLLMTSDRPPSGLDVSSYTLEEVDSITSEFILKNNDIFAVAVSLVTGRIVYISEQAAAILNCSMDVFKNSKFVELLTPQDVSVFYNFTTPHRLPSWSSYTGAESLPSDCVQEKSFFCRISGWKEGEGGLQHFPFRMTPYLMKVQQQLCCLLLAEKVHSGYEAPRIPSDKRVFTTTHTPSCVFQDVDERAVPLLGFLPQDLIGTPVLRHLHPKDRAAMLSIHRRIHQSAGQPFDHSSIRFCARNGEYIMLDTSWSSFINPWSRKVSFIIGRHKVRMGPVNEDVFVAPVSTPGKTDMVDWDFQEVTEQIHRLLLQPVHSSSSSGYSSLNTKDHLLSITCSSDSLGSRRSNQEERAKARPQSFQEVCKGIPLQRSLENQVSKPETRKTNTTGSAQRSAAAARPKDWAAALTWRDAGWAEEEEPPFNQQAVYSYQQISCLDSVIRYLESCNLPFTVKRKCQSTSTSDEERQKGLTAAQATEGLKNQTDICTLDNQDNKSTVPGSAVVGTSLPLPVPEKPESVVSVTSQCSYSSTIVHVGDKKPKPETETIEDLPAAGEMTESGPNHGPSPPPIPAPSQERGSYKKLGLTKEVLASHTQKEEQAFLHHFRELGGLTALKANCSHYLEQTKEQKKEQTKEQKKEQMAQQAHLCEQGAPPARPGTRKGTRNKKSRSKRLKQMESSDSTTSPRRRPHLRPPLLNHGLNQTSWSASDTSQSTCPVAYPSIVPAYPLQAYPRADPAANICWQGFEVNHTPAAPLCLPAANPYPSPMVNPFVALLLPNYLYPMMVPGALPPPPQAMFPPHPGAHPSQTLPFGQAAYSALPSFCSPNPTSSQSLPTAQTGFSSPVFCYPPPPETPKPAVDGQSRSTTPQSRGGGSRTSPQLFQSRCSSPLNLLELELSMERQDSAALSTAAPGTTAAERESGASGSQAQEREPKRTSSHGDENSSDANSLSTDMLDIILQEDSYSGTGSATSGSMGSNGCGTSASGTSNSRTSAGSNHSSTYFGSVDSSQNSQKVKGHQGSSSQDRPGEAEPSERLLHYVLQEPLWLLAANTDDHIMMAYQLPSRDLQQVLKDDQEKLRLLQKSQPHFTEEQKKELMEVHPWIQKATLPKAIDVQACPCCGCWSEAAVDVEDLLDLDLREAAEPSHSMLLSVLCPPDTTSDAVS